MSYDRLRKWLNLSASDNARAGDLLSKVKGVNTFFADTASALKDWGPAEALTESLPWKEIAGVTPVIKFAVDVFEKLTKENDPHVLGLLACTLAYQQSVQKALVSEGLQPDDASAKKEVEALRDQILGLEKEEEEKELKEAFATFSFQTALEHPFIKEADQTLEVFLAGLGYSREQRGKITTRVHRQFVGNLKALICNGKTEVRFQPFTKLMSLGTEQSRAYDYVATHVAYQRWQLEEEALSGREPFALDKVYIHTECGRLNWSQIKAGSSRRSDDAARVDPFVEDDNGGGRHDLMTTVLRLMRLKNFNEPIVIQGVAGSGKSSFTLKLCQELENQGLDPLRIRLRDLRLEQGTALQDLISDCLLPKEDRLPEHLKGRARENPFDAGIFNKGMRFGDAMIYPYVLILDGWDEISLAAEQGFRIRVNEMLRQIRQTYLDKTGLKYHVRVILTGRPTPDVLENDFIMKDQTPVLTIRPLSPAALGKLVEQTRQVLPATQPTESEGSAMAADGEPPVPKGWKMPPQEDSKDLLELYEKETAEHKKSVEAALEARKRSQRPLEIKPLSDTVALLGLPLLAYMSLRLFGEWKGRPQDLIKDSTRLYRHLMEVTCAGRGQPGHNAADIQGQTHHPHGMELRKLLHGVAVAMTARTKETIQYEELEKRMKTNQLAADVERLSQAFDMSAMVVAFFFKGGLTHLGCEFMHKSFREYLFAEAIVEAVKNYPGKDRAPVPLPRKYFADFDETRDEDRSLHAYSRTLAEILSSDWLRNEVLDHLERLLIWEISRPQAGDGDDFAANEAERTRMPQLTLRQWENIRDALAEVWKWWGEGVHMRSRIKGEVSSSKETDEPPADGLVKLHPPYAHKLVRLDAPRQPTKEWPLEPARTTTMDAHLGDGLFRLCAIVHFQIAVQRGWLKTPTNEGSRTPAELWAGVDVRDKSEISVTNAGDEAVEDRKTSNHREYQARIVQDQQLFVMFAPSGFDPYYFCQYMARINSAGWRPAGFFPGGVDMRGVDLRNSLIARMKGPMLKYRATDWRYTNLEGANATGGWMERDDFSCCVADTAQFELASLSGANFERASLRGTNFIASISDNANFAFATLIGASFVYSTVNFANFFGANVAGSSWRAARIVLVEGLPDWVHEATSDRSVIQGENPRAEPDAAGGE